jgi:GT2 family glycosyltransferase
MPEAAAVSSLPGDPSIDVIIVNWNGGPGVVSAARSAASFAGRAIVVDNGSNDDSVAQLRALGGVSVVEMGYNAGFARACNAGATSSDGEFIFLLNPDAEIVRGQPADIVDAFMAFPDGGVVGPRIIDSTGQPEPSVRGFPTVVAMVLYQLKLHPWARRLPPLRRYFMVGFDESEAAYVDQVIGAAMVVRRSDWLAIGGMDEGYFLLFEDVDLCRRLADRNLRAVHWPGLVVRHVGHGSFRRIGHLRLQRFWNRSLVRYSWKHLGLAGTVLIAATVPLSLVLSALLDLGRRPLTIRSHR